MLLAVIDAGTNTFTMNIYRLLGGQSFEKLPKERYYVNLAEDGIEQIGEKAQHRALKAFQAFRNSIDKLEVEQVFAFGTAALRRAENGQALIDKIVDKTKLQIELIDGEREAALIYSGVKHAAPLTKDNALIIDIGGGSVEFIICNANKQLWAESFPIGAAHLYNQFAHSDPISKEDESQLRNYLHQVLKALKKALTDFPVQILIGASGTFDALEAMIGAHQQSENFGYIALDKLEALYQKLKGLNYEERKKLPKLPISRARFIVVAMIMIEELIEIAGIKSDLIISDYALREGVLFEYLDQQA
jgi:exopolyphosphatase/guanosine-5'-triphosphate,3'-diphosphate pyrophosphatase